MCYEPKTQRVFTFNGRTNNSTAINAKTNEVIATIPVGGKPEFCRADDAGKVYVNLEDTAEIAEIDAAKPAVIAARLHFALRGTFRPGDRHQGRGAVLVLRQQDHGRDRYQEPEGDRHAGDRRGHRWRGLRSGAGLAFSSNGGDGTLSIVKQVSGKWTTVDTVQTERGARTMTVDPKTHRAYLLAAEFGPAPEGKKGRPPVLPDSFHVIVVGK